MGVIGGMSPRCARLGRAHFEQRAGVAHQMLSGGRRIVGHDRRLSIGLWDDDYLHDRGRRARPPRLDSESQKFRKGLRR